ncbi:Hypothetical protein NCS54_01368200 [Fusarium falciforme]|uniref:Hypothetical protein n=1 Tax=Fusarium falciforme TaxID=195108 RepID=UPI0023012CA0|nr:Hypothetical protein NCS54_01368200 [Fusarium falciforme]WAO96026.1 Hypothetical protein NCS54_01368200 [Fusarium falciforme]
MAFDRDDFVRLLTDYYEFCSRTFWDVTVQHAPAGGWPSINHETLARLQKNDQVVELLRHLPYPEFNQGVYTPLIMDHTGIVDWRSEYTHALIRNESLEVKPEPFTNRDPPLTPSCACIAKSVSRDGYFVVIDTEDGYIYWGDPNGEHDEPQPELNATLDRFTDDPANMWRDPLSGVNVYRPADFFALCKQRFRELRWIGMDQWNISALRMNYEWDELDEEDEHAELVAMMREAGWPGDGEGRGWDRAKFEALLQEENSEGGG